mgnify:CR=1 FL=1
MYVVGAADGGELPSVRREGRRGNLEGELTKARQPTHNTRYARHPEHTQTYEYARGTRSSWRRRVASGRSRRGASAGERGRRRMLRATPRDTEAHNIPSILYDMSRVYRRCW